MNRLLTLALVLLAASALGCDGGEFEVADKPAQTAGAATADADVQKRLAELEAENAALRAKADAPVDTKGATDAEAAGQEQKRVDALKKELADAGIDASAPGITAPQYTDTKLNVVPKAQADWVREATFREPVMAVKYVPTYEGYGGLQADDTGMGRFDVIYRWVETGQPAMQTSATAMMKAQSQYTYSGTTVWYDKAGTVIAKGTLEAGKIVGTLEKFDAAGNVTATEMYDNGKLYNPNRYADAASPLVGTWVEVSPSDHAKDGTRRLFNIYGPDGRVTIYAQQWSPNYRDKTKLDLNKTSDPVEYAWTWKPDAAGATQGTLELFDGLTLIARAKLAFDGPERFRSRTTFHASPSMVGSTYDFRREVGPELSKGVADARFVGDWVQDTAEKYSTTRLFNEYAADGIVTVYEQTWGHPSYKRDVPQVLQKTSEPSHLSWSYEPEGGTMNWLRDGRVISRVKVSFDGPDRFTEEVVFHDDVNQVGKTFAFRRHDGTPPEGATATPGNP